MNPFSFIKILQDILLLIEMLGSNTTSTITQTKQTQDTSLNSDSQPPHNTILYPRSGWTPRVDRTHSWTHIKHE